MGGPILFWLLRGNDGTLSILALVFAIIWASSEPRNSASRTSTTPNILEKKVPPEVVVLQVFITKAGYNLSYYPETTDHVHQDRNAQPSQVSNTILASGKLHGASDKRAFCLSTPPTSCASAESKPSLSAPAAVVGTSGFLSVFVQGTNMSVTTALLNCLFSCSNQFITI